MAEKGKARSGNHWAALFIVLFAISAAPIAMFKAATVMDGLMAEFSLNAAQSGLIISVFSLVPIFLAIPIGVIISKYGSWKLGLFGLICLVAGSLIGIASHSMTPLLASRVIEGVAMALFSNLGPAIVNHLFEPEKRGTAMGILLSFISVGQFIIFFLSPSLISAAGGWRGVWWFTAAYSLVFFFIWLFVLRNIDKDDAGQENADAGRAGKAVTAGVIHNSDVWLVTAAMLLYMIAQQGALNFIASFFTNVKMIDAAAASRFTSLIGVVGIIAMVLSGSLSDKLRSRKWLGVVLFFIAAVVYIIFPGLPAGMAVVSVAIFSLSVNMIPSLFFLVAGEAVDDPAGAPLATGILTTGQFLGTFLAAILFGAFVDSLGWTAAFIISGAIMAAGGVCFLCLRKVKR